MAPSLEMFLLFLIVGLVLIGIEVFVPGGVIGAFGALALLCAAVAGFFAFGVQGGFVAAIGLIILAGVFLIIWLRVFPDTAMGRKLSLHTSGNTFKSSTGELDALLHKEGVAQSALRPAGMAVFDGKRVDVVAESGYIPPGAPVRVVVVEGNRVVVRPVSPGSGTTVT